VLDKGKANPFGDGLMDAVVYLSKIIWHAIGDTVVAAKHAMQWLREVARLMAKQQLAIVWQTPAGFPVRQAYPEMRRAMVKFVVDGHKVQRRINVEADGLDKDRQINGLSPNFVHSLDAAALMESVREAKRHGIRSFAMVHDSYGTLAADTEVLAGTLRQAFVSLYQKHDVLAELRNAVVVALPAGAEVKPVPDHGSLNIDAVLESKFFFA
jgi:DNA-directed RNA polymerase